VRDCAETTCKAVEDLLQTSEDFMRIVREAGDKSLATRLAGDLIGYPVLEVTEVAERYSVAYPTANNAVRKLVGLGILERISNRSYRRLFFCTRVYQIIARL
jgi:Fic family protein